MKLAIMQPYFMPYIGYFQAIAAVDKYILYSNLNFIKEAWMNRNRILMRDGRIYQFTVPLLHKSSNQMIRDVRIDNSKPWSQNLLLTIASNYKKAPFFNEIFPLFDSLLSKEYTTLTGLNAETIISIARFLGINTAIEFDNSRFLDMENSLSCLDDDYSQFPYMKKTRPIRKTARVLEMCRMEGADQFVNAIGGQALYNKDEFKEYGIDLKFIKTNEISYSQNNRDIFSANLSIIDVLMFNGLDGAKELLNEYELV